jgi:hypothetical protein
MNFAEEVLVTSNAWSSVQSLTKASLMMSVDVVDNGELHKLWGLL